MPGVQVALFIALLLIDQKALLVGHSRLMTLRKLFYMITAMGSLDWFWMMLHLLL